MKNSYKLFKNFLFISYFFLTVHSKSEQVFQISEKKTACTKCIQCFHPGLRYIFHENFSISVNVCSMIVHFTSLWTLATREKSKVLKNISEFLTKSYVEQLKKNVFRKVTYISDVLARVLKGCNTTLKIR